MADTHGNIGFDDAVTSYALGLLAESVADVDAVGAMIQALYPNADHGPADRARRNASSALRDLANVRRAIEALSGAERGSQTAQQGSEQEGRRT